MSFNKEKHLRTNIEAIRLCFQLENEKRSPTPDETTALKQYSGFGALKCILNFLEELTDIAHWPNSEVELYPLVAELLFENGIGFLIIVWRLFQICKII